jgi:hypothetical protein
MANRRISDFGYRPAKGTPSKSNSWMSSRPVFRKCQRKYGPLLTDTCAEAWNAQLPRYYSPVYDAGSAGVDGLIQYWEAGNWCCPPFDDIYPWVAKAVASIADGAWTVLLMPTWTSAPWCRDFPLLTQCPHEFLPWRPIFTPKTQTTKRDGIKGLKTTPFHMMIIVIGIENRRRYATA